MGWFVLTAVVDALEAGFDNIGRGDGAGGEKRLEVAGGELEERGGGGAHAGTARAGVRNSGSLTGHWGGPVNPSIDRDLIGTSCKTNDTHGARRCPPSDAPLRKL